MNVHLITVVGENLDLLAHMLVHYRGLGIESLRVSVNARSARDPVLEQAREIARACGAEIESVTIGDWLHSSNQAAYARVREPAPEDWFVIADQDELQQYPRDLHAILEECERRNFDFIEGCFLDRFAADGSFPAVQPDVSIWRQFPLAGSVSAPILGANPNKVVAARGRVKLSPGQHYALDGAGWPADELYVPVHHFKWVQGIVERLEQRAEFRRRSGDRYWEESQRFVDYCRQHGGRPDLTDPAFHLAESAPGYEHWEQVSRMSRQLFRELVPEHHFSPALNRRRHSSTSE